MCVKSQCGAYEHVASMLERTGIKWWIAVLEAYFDDSGTDGRSPIAAAACYVSSAEQWTHFTRNWNEVAIAEGFTDFHMAEFVAKPEANHEPFCHWGNDKKDRVYRKLSSIINVRIQKGFAIAIPKHVFDESTFAEFAQGFAADHYTFAVKTILGFLEAWRDQRNIDTPIQYVFDQGSSGQWQIEELWTKYRNYEGASRRFGIHPSGFMFQDRKVFKPLQAADILAWQTQNQIKRTALMGRDPDDRSLMHKGLKQLLDKTPVEVGFYSRAQMRKVFDGAKEFKSKNGVWPWETNPLFAKVRRDEPGDI